MSWTRFFRRRYWDQERARELEAYIEAETDENIARGMSPQEARGAGAPQPGNACTTSIDRLPRLLIPVESKGKVSLFPCVPAFKPPRFVGSCGITIMPDHRSL